MPNDFTNSLLPEFTRAPEPVAKQSAPSIPPMPMPALRESEEMPMPPPLPAEAAGAKNDDGKPDWSLLPLPSVEDVVAVLTHGAKKYGRENWRNVEHAEDRYFSAAMRHLVAHQRDELNDEESGRPHLAHAICSLLFLMELQK